MFCKITKVFSADYLCILPFDSWWLCSATIIESVSTDWCNWPFAKRGSQERKKQCKTEKQPIVQFTTLKTSPIVFHPRMANCCLAAEYLGIVVLWILIETPSFVTLLCFFYHSSLCAASPLQLVIITVHLWHCLGWVADTVFKRADPSLCCRAVI